MDINIHIHQELSSQVRDFNYSLPILKPRLVGFTYDELVELRSILIVSKILKHWDSEFDKEAQDRLREVLY